MNDLPRGLKIGTLGELLVQIRLLQYGVQAAPPLKDSGNDLIAVRGNVFKAIQVKTTTGASYGRQNLPDRYHLLAVVQLQSDGEGGYRLDESKLFLMPKDEVENASTTIDRLERFFLTAALVEDFFH